MGIAVADTRRPEAANMDSVYLEKIFSGRLAFHCMIFTAGPMTFGISEEVKWIVRKTLEVIQSYDGYCLAHTYRHQDDSLTKMPAMYETALGEL